MNNASDLLYISNYETSVVKVYSWPDLAQEHTLRGFTHQSALCTNKKGDVWVANTNALELDEYAHGGTKPIATLADLPSYYPESCAVDPVTGDLAVTNLGYGYYGSRTANLLIFKHGKGKPKPYVISSIYFYYECGYDDQGNLIVNGVSRVGELAFAIMPHGKTTLQTLTLDQTMTRPGGIQWDGKHWAIGDQNATIYQFDVKDNKGTKMGTTTLDLHDAVYQFAIFGDRVVAPEYATGQAQIFKYPQGGAALATISKLHLPQGVAISPGQ